MKAKRFRNSILSCVVATMLVLGLSAGVFAEKAEMYPEKQLAFDWLDQPEIFGKFARISDAIWTYAELGLREYKTSKLCSDTLEEAGFKLERGLNGMPTSFMASYGSGRPVIVIHAELDALPMISNKAVPYQDPLVEGAPGHGCGHNMQAAAGIAAGLAVKRAIDRYGLQGTVKVYGSPAEETIIARGYSVRDGLFDDVDATIDNHSSSGFGSKYGKSGNALFSTTFTFTGITAHGASAWGGRSALDAVELMNHASNMLREHLYYTYRMHYVIMEGGEAPNVVPDVARVWYFIRNSDERIQDNQERLIRCAQGAALATDTEVSIRVLTAIHQRNHNQTLGELSQRNIELVGMPEWSDEEQAFARELQKYLGKAERGLPTEIAKIRTPSPVFTGGGTSDVGEVTRVVPTGYVGIPGRIPGASSHHWSTVAATGTTAAHKGVNAAAKAMAGVTIDLMTRPELLKEAKAEFDAWYKDNPYTSMLPDDAVPPIEMYEEAMAKWRPLMEPTYLQP